MHDLMDAGLVELGNSRHPQEGVKNPLAALTKMVDGEEVLVSPVGSEVDSESTRVEVRELTDADFCSEVIHSPLSLSLSPPQSPQLFPNPIYHLAATGNSKKAGLEAELSHHQSMIAANSTDDITLISKKKKVTKTRSSDIPYSSSPSHQEPQQGKQSTLPHLSFMALQDKKRLSNGSAVKYPLETTRKTSDEVIPATDIDTGRTVMVSRSQENLDLPLVAPPHRYKSPAARTSASHQPSPVKRTGNVAKLHAHSQSFDCATPPLPERSKVGQRSSYNFDLSDGAKVLKLRAKFDGDFPSSAVSPPPPIVQSNGQSHSGTRTELVHRNSTENNSDSGHESMLESDPLPILSPSYT